MRDIGAEWIGFENTGEADAIVACAFGLQHPIDPEGPDVAAWLALLDLGVTAGRIVREPRFRRSRNKAERDAALDRPTIHLAPLWRHPITGEENGFLAIILPVGAAPDSHSVSLPVRRSEHCDFASAIFDLIAIPLDGSRTLSFTGHTAAISEEIALRDLFPGRAGRLVLFGGGKAWLEAYIAQARTIAADTPPHLVEQLHVPFPSPTLNGALVVEPRAFEWRVVRYDCVIPPAAREVLCPDSRKLAELIDVEMRRKDTVRPFPVVRGPAPARVAERAAA